ncbi:hypothetical protein SDC9_117066 [bioreactor metagenome]|uniref:Uncharacterized protein n=1 Tax=bioreactor metagenome TaxID=1076179 RepID=A0A645C7U9_9ZZZZ
MVAADDRPARVHLCGVDFLDVRLVRRIEHGEFHALHRACVFIRIVADAQQQVVLEHVEVFREARNLQRIQNARGSGVAQVHRKERIDLTEGHKVADAAVEAHALDKLVLGEVFDLAEHLQVEIQRVERVCARAVVLIGVHAVRKDALLRAVERGHDAEHVLVLIHRELVEEAAGHVAAGKLRNLSFGEAQQHEVRVGGTVGDLDVFAVLVWRDGKSFFRIAREREQQVIRVGVELARSTEDRLCGGEVCAALEVDRTHNGVGRALRVAADVEVCGLEQPAFHAVGGGGDIGNRRALHGVIDILRGHKVDIVPDHAGADIAAALPEGNHLKRFLRVADVVDDRAGLVGVGLIASACVVDPDGVEALRDDHQPVAQQEHLGVIAPPAVLAGKRGAGDEPGCGAVGLEDVELVARHIIDVASVGFHDVRFIHALDLHVGFGIIRVTCVAHR